MVVAIDGCRDDEPARKQTASSVWSRHAAFTAACRGTQAAQ